MVGRRAVARTSVAASTNGRCCQHQRPLLPKQTLPTLPAEFASRMDGDADGDYLWVLWVAVLTGTLGRAAMHHVAYPAGTNTNSPSVMVASLVRSTCRYDTHLSSDSVRNGT